LPTHGQILEVIEKEKIIMLIFLKPSLLKIVIALTLSVGLTWLWGFVGNLFIMDASFYGVPLKFFTVWGPCQAGQNCSEFNALNLVLDIGFWYIVSAFIVNRLAKSRSV
jgi:hypothetical protein